MKILLIGDPHFSENYAEVIEEFIEEVYKLDLKVYHKIIILGDILDTHEKINLRSLCKATNFIKKLSTYSKTYVLIGNHDRINNNVFLNEEHPFIALKELKNIVIIDKPLSEEGYLYVPYVQTGRFYEAIQNIDLSNIKTIFAHQEFKGAIFNDQGDKIPEIKTYSGHIHNYRKIGNLTYVGTPYQHSFHDNPDKFLMELEGGKESKIYLETTKKRIENIKLSQLLDYKVDPKYYTRLVIEVDKKLLNNKKIKEILNHPKIRYKIDKDIDMKKDNKFSNIGFEKLLSDRLKNENINVNNIYNSILKKL